LLAKKIKNKKLRLLKPTDYLEMKERQGWQKYLSVDDIILSWCFREMGVIV